MGIIDSRWALLACVGGVTLGPQGVLDTNMLVSPTRKSWFEGLDQFEAPTRMVLRCNGI